MAKRKRWSESPIRNGYGEVKIISWRYFFDYVHQEMLNYQTYIWRGQRCDNWKLESTLDRLIRRTKIHADRRYRFRTSHLEQFKYAVRGRRGPNPASLISENDWWALGQHHGLATPLLDWTTSPFVAAYFAFIGTGENQSKDRAVYALHKPSVEAKVAELYQAKKAENAEKKQELEASGKTTNSFTIAMLSRDPRREVEFITPLSDENQRLVNQGGLFTRAPDGKTMEKWVEQNHETENSGYVLMKILLPNSDREKCLKTLNRMNINHLTLFPDLYGASKFCNLFGEIEKY